MPSDGSMRRACSMASMPVIDRANDRVICPASELP
jgi:hypothetical protein